MLGSGVGGGGMVRKKITKSLWITKVKTNSSSIQLENKSGRPYFYL